MYNKGMFKVIPFLLALTLAACGGGSSEPKAKAELRLASVSFDSNYSFVPSVAVGDFTGTGEKYAVVAGWYASNQTVNVNPDPSVKIFRIAADRISDVTVSILGSEFNASVNMPLVADFNNDGIDDIFFAGFTDAPAYDFNKNYVFLSRRGLSHAQVTVPGLTWSHGATTADLDSDGDIDVINSYGQIWLNDGSGNFSFVDHTYNSSPPYWMHGSGVCVGDFNNSGKPQIVITDLNLDGNKGPVIDNAIFELNSLLKPVAGHNLPKPYYDTNSVNEESHDVSCVVADLNGDGLKDIIVISALDSASVRQGTADHEHIMQVYLNQGNFVFSDATNLVYRKTSLSSYIPKVIDYNNDGKLDVWLASWDTLTSESNILWINDGTGSFTEYQSPVMTVRNSINSLAQNYVNKGFILPVKINNEWAFVASNISRDKLNIGIIKP